MKKNQFIAQLIKEEKIRMIEPSIEVAASYQEKSKNTLRAAKLLLSQGLHEEATSMAYYAMYNKATSLFSLLGIKCENHAATIILLKELFEIDNTKISFAKRERIDKQYYPNFSITPEGVQELINDAETFTALLDQYVDDLTENEKIDLRNRFSTCYYPHKS